MKQIVTILTSSVLLALLPSMAQAQTQTVKEPAPQSGSADAGGLAGASVGKPAKTVGGATRGVKKNADGKDPSAAAKEKAEESKPAPAAATSK
ncbi:MAG: hypothetical protein HZA62_14900 [Rhodocyclales bacterium]|nr:hypothetical protein [Rhodocyclales bacterium]